jgi:hypothetical protein
MRRDSGQFQNRGLGIQSMSTATHLTGRLESVLGANRVVSAEEELREYAVDGVVPSAIARPGSSDEVENRAIRRH